MTKRVLIVGAGLAGAVCAQQYHLAGHQVCVIDSRSHIAGNCYTERDRRTGVLEHIYGPHIFNTSIPRVWAYVNTFADWRQYVNRVKAVSRTGLYSMPLNLHTINQFFNTTFNPAEAQRFISSLSEKQYENAQNFEEQAKYLMGTALYNEFFYGYTKKQWGCEPSELPASILKRLPIRFNYDDNYYNSKWQAMPVGGYTEFIQKLLMGCEVILNQPYEHSMAEDYDEIIYTGPIDQYYDYIHGRLGYRTVYWDKEFGEGDLQGNAVINYTSEHIKFTRRAEHKHFAPWENIKPSILLTEYSKETEPGDVPFYPKRLPVDLYRLGQYQQLAQAETKVVFCGRLGTYTYMNMDQVIDQALSLCEKRL